MSAYMYHGTQQVGLQILGEMFNEGLGGAIHVAGLVIVFPGNGAQVYNEAVIFNHHTG